MNAYRLTVWLCLGLLCLAMGSQQGLSSESTSPIVTGLVWGFPLVLGTLAWLQVRWVLMVGVIGGTIGLALDLSTFIQVTAEGAPLLKNVWGIVISGCLNLLLIVVGGAGFLRVGE